MYSPQYADPRIRSSSYDVSKLVVNYFKASTKCALDLGCGTCRKLIPLASKVQKYVAIDVQPEMLRLGQKLVTAAGIANIEMHIADSRATPFDSQTFDLVTSFLSHFSPAEVFRLLKPEGVFIVETLGGNDKRQIKQAFGRDHLGSRGYLLTQSARERKALILASMRPFFVIDDVLEIRFATTMVRSSLELLLRETPTVRNFDSMSDKHILDRLFDGSQDIEFTEHRLIIAAHKRRVILSD